jgi:hypothetical protein
MSIWPLCHRNEFLITLSTRNYSCNNVDGISVGVKLEDELFSQSSPSRHPLEEAQIQSSPPHLPSSSPLSRLFKNVHYDNLGPEEPSEDLPLQIQPPFEPPKDVWNLRRNLKDPNWRSSLLGCDFIHTMKDEE